MRPSRLIVFGAALAVLALAVAPMATPARAESIGQEKIDPALRDLMSSRPFALLPVIVEMQNPLPPFSGAPNVNRAREALDLLGLNGTQVAALSLINGAAGFANAAGITAMSLVPAVAAIHHDATIVAADALPNAASALSLDPLPTPPPLLPPPATPTPLPIATATPTPTPAPTAAPSPTLAPTPAPTTAPSASPPLPPDPTPTPAPSGPPPIQSGTPPPSPSPTATPVPSAPPTPTASATPWPTPAPSDAPPPTQSGSPPPSPSPSVTPTPTAPPTPTASATPSPTAGPAAQAPPFSAVYPRAVRANEVWTKQTTGKGVTVAVLDSGVAADPDLVEPANRILASVNFADQRPVSDPGGHGTHVAGIIAGNGTRSGGQFVGIAPQANIVDVRVLGRTGSGRISSVVRGIEWVIAHRFTYNIRVINLSFGAPARTSYRADPLAAAVEIAWRRGLVVVAAAGNGGPGRDTVASPGIDPYVITVGATDDRGTAGTSDDTLAFFSAWGSPDSNPKPDLVAPGRRIVSIRVAGSALDQLFPDRVVLATNGSTYFRLSGTSMATPVVSGAVALLLEYRPKLTPDQVKALLVATTQPYGQASGVIPPDPKAGGSGMLDAAALQPGAAPPPGGVPPVNLALRPANGLARGLFPVLYGGPLRWKDPTLGGIAWSLLSWDSVSWESVAWDNYDWDSVAWDSVAWDSVAWDAFTLD